jgi:PAS domain S-box-containing protein
VDGDLGGEHVSLPALPTSVGEARRLVRQVLMGAGRADLVDSAELVVSEAVTNALVHAGTAIDLTVHADATHARLEVDDGSPHLPRERGYALTSTTGRGLMVFNGLTSSWGTAPRLSGKTVWFELDGASHHRSDPLNRPGTSARHGRAPRRAPAGRTRGSATVPVDLPGFPMLLYAAWCEYAESLLREYLLAGLDEDDDEDAVRVHAESSQALALLAEQIPLRPLSDHPSLALADAEVPTRATAHVQLRLPVASVLLFATLEVTLEAAGELAELATSLTSPIQPEMRHFRRWLCDQVATQAQDAPATPWIPHPYAAPTAQPAAQPLNWDLASVTLSADALVASDDTNSIIAVSTTAVELLGYDAPEQLIGQRLIAIIPDRYREAHVAGFTLHLLNGRDTLLDTRVVVPVRRRDGTETVIALVVKAHRADDGRAVFLATLDAP